MNEFFILQSLFRVIYDPDEKITVTIYNEKDDPLITFILPGWEFLNDFIIDDPVLSFSIPALNQIKIKINTTEDPEIIDPGDYFQPQIIINGKRLEDWLVDFQGATATEDGVTGLVPAPKAGDQGKYLRANGTWGNPGGGGGGSSEAIDINYDHSTSKLVASDVQRAIDELTEKKLDKTKIHAETSSIGSASGWNAGAVPVFEIEDGVLKITMGQAPSLNITSKTVVTEVTIE